MSREEAVLIEKTIRTQPLKLLTLAKDRESIAYINSFLPYSIGFEIECNYQEGFDMGHFQSIPNIMAVDCDSTEQRFRIPAGILGMVCLWHITEALAVNSELNPLSGIHYHVDMTDNWNLINRESIQKNEQWILEELDKWKYTGSFNSRSCQLDTRCWVRFDSYKKTAEFRIGEMSFDYKTIIDRMITASEIVTRVIKNLGGKKIANQDTIILNPQELVLFVYQKGMARNNNLNHLYDKLEKLKSKTEQEEEENIEAIIRNRLIR